MASDEPLLGDIQSTPVKRKATTWILILAVIGLTVALIVVAVHKSSSSGGEDTIVYSLDYNTTQRILSFLNQSVDPCEDFYEYACGNFHHVIPEGDGGTYAYSFSSIADLVHAQQLQILTSNFPMISDFYSGCMDTDTIETRNVVDLVPWFERIDNATDVAALLGVVGALQRAGFASSAFVNTAIQPDLHYADVYRLYMTPSGLTLGDPKAYEGNITLQGQMFELLLGVYNYTITDPDPMKAKVIANLKALEGSVNVWNVETAIANISHPLSDQGLQILATNYTYPLFLSLHVGLDWSQYFIQLKASPNPIFDEIAVIQIEFFSALTSIFKSSDLIALQDYVKFHTILGVTQYLPEYFREVGQELSDQYDVPAYVNSAARMAKRRALDEIPAATLRQRYCQAETINQFENYLSHEWLISDLPSGTLPAVSNLVDIIYDQIGQRLKTVDWLKNDNATRDAAVWKWQNIAKNVGPTSSWYRYSHLLMTGLPLIDRETVQAYYLDQTAKMYGQKVNRSQSSPNTDWTNQNAFYDPTTNSINLLPGLMFPPFYSPNVPTFLNLATYGMVIGHEITHGFDNSGRHYNGSGAYVEWWTAETAAEFDRRATCLVNQYESYPVLNTHVHGNQTLGENIADNGGIRAAWNAYQKQPTADINKPAMAQFNNDKLFFVYFAQSWCTNRTAESQINQLNNDVHSPAKWRVNGPLSNLPYFANTYGCRADQPMGRSLDDKKRCEVW